MHRESTASTQSGASIPADDLSRDLAIAQPNTDGSLAHIGLAGDTYTDPTYRERHRRAILPHRYAYTSGQEAHLLIGMTSRRRSRYLRVNWSSPFVAQSRRLDLVRQSTFPRTLPICFGTFQQSRRDYFVSALPRARKNSL